MSKFTLKIDCGIFGTFAGVGSFEPNNTVKVTMCIPTNASHEECKLIYDVALMVQEYFDMGMTKGEQQIFRHEMHNPDHNKHFILYLNKHFSLG